MRLKIWKNHSSIDILIVGPTDNGMCGPIKTLPDMLRRNWRSLFHLSNGTLRSNVYIHNVYVHTYNLTNNNIGAWFGLVGRSTGNVFLILRLPKIKKQITISYYNCYHKIKIYKYRAVDGILQSQTGTCIKCKKYLTIASE